MARSNASRNRVSSPSAPESSREVTSSTSVYAETQSSSKRLVPDDFEPTEFVGADSPPSNKSLGLER